MIHYRLDAVGDTGKVGVSACGAKIDIDGRDWAYAMSAVTCPECRKKERVA